METKVGGVFKSRKIKSDLKSVATHSIETTSSAQQYISAVTVVMVVKDQ